MIEGLKSVSAKVAGAVSRRVSTPDPPVTVLWETALLVEKRKELPAVDDPTSISALAVSAVASRVMDRVNPAALMVSGPAPATTLVMPAPWKFEPSVTLEELANWRTSIERSEEGIESLKPTSGVVMLRVSSELPPWIVLPERTVGEEITNRVPAVELPTRESLPVTPAPTSMVREDV